MDTFESMPCVAHTLHGRPLAPPAPANRSRKSALPRAAAQAAMIALLGLACATPGHSQAVDPPGFAPVPVKGAQTIAMNVVCFDHAVGGVEPVPCRGELMLHDAAGRELKRGSYELLPGQAMTLRLAIPATNAAGEPIRRVMIIPCIIPSDGLAIPSVEVFDREAGRVVLFENPAAARMSDFDDGAQDRVIEAQLAASPDSPGFGVATLRGDQSMRMNVFCFAHEVAGYPPNPCIGNVMFHDMAGNVLRRGSYELKPGQSRSFEFVPPVTRAGALVGIVPCVIPAPGGRAVPNVEVTDGAGNVALLVNPAVSRMSDFQRQDARLETAPQ